MLKRKELATKELCLRFAVIAASSQDSIENTTKTLNNTPKSNEIRYHLEKINNFEELEAQLNLALKSRIRIGVKKGCNSIAIDLNLIP